MTVGRKTFALTAAVFLSVDGLVGIGGGVAGTQADNSLCGFAAQSVAGGTWFNKTPTTSGHPNGQELMMWLNHKGGVQPGGSRQATATRRTR